MDSTLQIQRKKPVGHSTNPRADFGHILSVYSEKCFPLPTDAWKVCMIYVARHLLFDLSGSLGFFTISLDDFVSGKTCRELHKFVSAIRESLRFMSGKFMTVIFKARTGCESMNFPLTWRIWWKLSNEEFECILEYSISPARHVPKLKPSRVPFSFACNLLELIRDKANNELLK